MKIIDTLNKDKYSWQPEAVKYICKIASEHKYGLIPAMVITSGGKTRLTPMLIKEKIIKSEYGGLIYFLPYNNFESLKNQIYKCIVSEVGDNSVVIIDDVKKIKTSQDFKIHICPFPDNKQNITEKLIDLKDFIIVMDEMNKIKTSFGMVHQLNPSFSCSRMNTINKYYSRDKNPFLSFTKLCTDNLVIGQSANLDEVINSDLLCYYGLFPIKPIYVKHNKHNMPIIIIIKCYLVCSSLNNMV